MKYNIKIKPEKQNLKQCNTLLPISNNYFSSIKVLIRAHITLELNTALYLNETIQNAFSSYSFSPTSTPNQTDPLTGGYNGVVWTRYPKVQLTNNTHSLHLYILLVF